MMEAMREAARFRSAMMRKIRSFFDERAYLEVDTPVLSPTLIPESTIENFATRFDNPFLPSQELYLVPSPEVYMKRLIADGWGSIYQISHCFRNSEQLGKNHNIEFTMLEYYTTEADEQDSIAITEELFAALITEDTPDYLRPLCPSLRRGGDLDLGGVDLERHQRQSTLAGEARRLGLTVPDRARAGRRPSTGSSSPSSSRI